MATFFQKAAMTLLSKTLQTVLSKYLSDVDVEGVALPSIYDEGQSSWGVRLSNVKLRDGAKLMDLPGKPPKKEKDKEKATKDENASKEGSSTKSKPEEDKGEEVVEITEASVNGDDIDHTETSQPVTMPVPVEAPPESQRSALDVTESDTDTQPSAVDPPKLAKRSSSWFSWYSTAEKPEKQSAAPDDSLPNKEAPSSTQVPVLPSAPSSIQSLHLPLQADGSIAPHSGQSIGDLSMHSAPPVQRSTGSHSGDPVLPTASTESVEPEVEPEDPPMTLRLGKDGKIGLLDVRLVGKNIQVLVEDAYLTVEAVRLTPTGGDTSTEKKPQDKKAAVPKKKMDPKTVGDRVMAENALARIFSSMPNLLLRDVNVRFVIRDEEVGAHEMLDTSEYNYGDNDAIIEIGIEFLSVTDGEDFLAKFRAGGESESEDGDSSDEDESDDMFSATMGTGKVNEFLTKRIRTGRGPEGGITLRMFRGGDRLFGGDDDNDGRSLWARRNFISATQYYVLRLSGWDLQARVFLGTKNENETSAYTWYGDDDFNVDAMLLGGVDYVAPGPKPPLPPMEETEVPGDPDATPWTIPGASLFVTDANGVQSCSVPSSFHRVARGLTPVVCKKDHLPCEYCKHCWESTQGVKRENALDEMMPMAGLALHLSARDPLEINVDRQDLEIAGILFNLFRKPKTDNEQPEATSSQPGADASGDASGQPGSSGEHEVSTTPTLQRQGSRFSLMRTSSRDDRDDDSDPIIESAESKDSASAKVEGIDASFPSYMAPEKIQLLGFHFSELRIRVHVMRSEGMKERDLSFCYWDFHAKCATADLQMLKDPTLGFQDVRCDIGHLTGKEYKGSHQKQLLSLGVRQRVVDFDEMTVETAMTARQGTLRPPWPSTAAALMEMPPPLETLAYENRERHALQLRYVSVKNQGSDCDRNRATAYLRAGAASADMPFAIRHEITTLIREARTTVLGPPVVSNATQGKKDSLLRYRVRADGGHVRMPPLIDVRLPLTDLDGELASDTGLFFSTLLSNVEFSFGTSAGSRVLERGLSLQQLSQLPEQVRLRLLLFLDDLSPLEKAMGIRPEANSFLRCRAVNKAIVRMAKIVSRNEWYGEPSNKGQSAAQGNRRQELLTKVMKMDDDDLEEVLMIYDRNVMRRSGHGRSNRP